MWIKKSLRRFGTTRCIVGIAVAVWMSFGAMAAAAMPSAQGTVVDPACGGIDATDFMNLECIKSTGTGYIPRFPLAPDDDVSPYLHCPGPGPTGDLAPTAGNYQPGQILRVAISGFKPNETIELGTYSPSSTPLMLAKMGVMKITTDANGTGIANVYLHPDTVPGTYSITACSSESGCSSFLDFGLQATGEQLTSFANSYRVTQRLNFRTQPRADPVARIRSVLAPGSVVKPIEYPRRAADGSLWYPVISDAVPDAIGWVNSAGLTPTEATLVTAFTQEILARYAAKKGCPKPPGPGPGCSADPNAGVAPCLQIDAQNIVTP